MSVESVSRRYAYLVNAVASLQAADYRATAIVDRHNQLMVSGIVTYKTNGLYIGFPLGSDQSDPRQAFSGVGLEREFTMAISEFESILGVNAVASLQSASRYTNAFRIRQENWEGGIYQPDDYLNEDGNHVTRLIVTCPDFRSSVAIINSIAEGITAAAALAGNPVTERHDHGDAWSESLADSVDLTFADGSLMYIMAESQRALTTGSDESDWE